VLIKRSERHRTRGRVVAAQASGTSDSLDRRSFLQRSGLTAGALAALGSLPLGSVRKAEAGPPPDFWAAYNWDLGPARQLFWIEAEGVELPAPFSRRVAEAVRYRCRGVGDLLLLLDEIGREEGERDGHINLPNAALLASAKLCDRGLHDLKQHHPATDDLGRLR